MEVWNQSQRWKLFDRLIFTDSCFWKIDQCRESCGFESVEGEDIDLEPDDFPGRTGYVQVVHREWNGETQSEVKRWIWDPEEIAEIDSTKPF